MAELLAVDRYMFAEERAVVFGICDIADDARGVLGLFFSTVCHLRRHRLATEKCLEARNDGEVYEELSGLARGVVARLGTVRTDRQGGMGSCEGTARIDTAMVGLWLESREAGDMGLRSFPGRDFAVWERGGKLCIRVTRHMGVDFQSEGTQDPHIIFSKILPCSLTSACMACEE